MLKANTAQFISITVVRATMRFRSLWDRSLAPASKSPITARELEKRFSPGASDMRRVL